MKYSLRLVLACLVVILVASCNQKKRPKNLLDKNLSQWGMYLSYRHANDYKGEQPTDTNGNLVSPIGYNKNVDSVFSVQEDGGPTILRISGEIYGCLFTKQEFENYDLKLKVKWGVLKWAPRVNILKDAGICYHSIGECGADYWRSWMLSQEFQVMQGHMGDYWNIANSAIDIKAFMPEGTMNPVAGHNQPFLPLGTGAPTAGFCLRTNDNASPDGEWTDLELICYQGKSLHIVNGQVVMVLANSRYHVNNKDFPLTKGKIQLQSEGAEVFYKDITIENIDKLPEAYEAFFK